jgi:hypothetical protein
VVGDFHTAKLRNRGSDSNGRFSSFIHFSQRWNNVGVVSKQRDHGHTTSGHGLWNREQGWNEYSTKLVLLQYNLTTGAFSARQEARGTLVLGESGSKFTASSSTTVFFANGNPPATGCSTAVGVRFE